MNWFFSAHKSTKLLPFSVFRVPNVYQLLSIFHLWHSYHPIKLLSFLSNSFRHLTPSRISLFQFFLSLSSYFQVHVQTNALFAAALYLHFLHTSVHSQLFSLISIHSELYSTVSFKIVTALPSLSFTIIFIQTSPQYILWAHTHTLTSTISPNHPCKWVEILPFMPFCIIPFLLHSPFVPFTFRCTTLMPSVLPYTHSSVANLSFFSHPQGTIDR